MKSAIIHSPHVTLNLCVSAKCERRYFEEFWVQITLDPIKVSHKHINIFCVKLKKVIRVWYNTRETK